MKCPACGHIGSAAQAECEACGLERCPHKGAEFGHVIGPGVNIDEGKKKAWSLLEYDADDGGWGFIGTAVVLGGVALRITLLSLAGLLGVLYAISYILD